MANRRHVVAHLLAAFWLFGCAVDPPMSAGPKPPQQALDRVTGAGIADMILVQTYSRTTRHVGGATTVCIHLSVGRTDGDGRFKIEDYRGDGPSAVVLYKPGWAPVDDPEARRRGIRYFTQFRGTAQERFQQLSRLFAPLGCPGAEQNPQLLPLSQGVYEEAWSLARTREERRHVEDGFLRAYESLAYGAEVAAKRQAQRQLQRMREGPDK